MMTIKIMKGERAPNFTLLACDGKQYTLDSFPGKGIVLFFYNKDNTPNCSKEAEDFSQHLHEFHNLGYEVVGVSPDSCDTHKKFINKRDLSILLLSDENYNVASAYGAYGEKKLFAPASSSIIRSTFVIDQNKDVLLAEYHINVENHAQEILDFLTNISKAN